MSDDDDERRAEPEQGPAAAAARSDAGAGAPKSDAVGDDDPDADAEAFFDAPTTSAAFPSRAAIAAHVNEQIGRVGPRDVARAFNLKGADRIALKRLLREMEAEGEIDLGRRKDARPGGGGGGGGLPPVALLVVSGVDADGDLIARPAAWRDDAPAPEILLAPAAAADPSLGVGDRFLARLRRMEGAEAGPAGAYEARILKKLPKETRRVVGVFERGREGGRVVSIDKKGGDDLLVESRDAAGAEPGELVEVEVLKGRRRFGLKHARVVERLGPADEPRAISRIAVLEHGIPVEFPEDALAEAEAVAPFDPEAPGALEGREDLRAVPLITIDPEDARDHDDAVHAAPDPDPANPGGFALWVAIADVAHYVRPGRPLDRAARARGNSAYFPDRVVPMLPERLSADLCSLRPGVERPCLAARMIIDADGALVSARFARAVMRSAARLTYGEAQAAVDGAPSEAAAPLLEPVIRPLFAAYAALAAARERRSPLELDLPERRVRIGESGEIASIELRERFDAHRLVEEFMILANVAAAEALETRRVGLLYRVHEEPTTEKIEALREILHSAGVPLAKGQVMTPRLLNRALAAARGTENAEMINISVLRAQTQAYYWPENLHHFGLALRSYAHFTSPIRRYADLIVHRALIRALGLGADPRADGLSALEEEGLADTAEHISMTERRAMAAERDTTDRYLARHLSDAEGAEFEARISGVQRFGLFVKLEETGADGFVPISTLEGDRFRHDEAGGRLIGERSRLEIPLGATARVRLLEATPVSGGLVFELTDWRAVARKGDGARRGASTLKKGKRPAKPKGIGARLAKRRGRPKR